MSRFQRTMSFVDMDFVLQSSCFHKTQSVLMKRSSSVSLHFNKYAEQIFLLDLGNELGGQTAGFGKPTLGDL